MGLTCSRVTAPTDIASCYSIRRHVFINEQGIHPSLERDPLDEFSVHFLGKMDGEPIATARLVKSDDIAQIQRMAVLPHFRQGGVGRELMKAMIAYARHDGFTQVVLGSQVAVIGFYQTLGFAPFGEQYQEADISHQNMRLTL